MSRRACVLAFAFALSGSFACDHHARSSQPACGDECVDAAVPTCDTLREDGSDHCSACGCEGPGTCDPATDQCVALADGASCDIDRQCASMNCGVPTRGSQDARCLAALGAPCADTNCAECHSDGTNSYCSRRCDPDREPFAVAAEAEGGTVFHCVEYFPGLAKLRPRCSRAEGCALDTQTCVMDSFEQFPESYCETRRGLEHALCDSGCDTPLHCHVETYSCERHHEVGESCEDNRACLHACEEGQCAPFVPRTRGEACGADNECASGLCREETCLSSPQRDGEACSDALECTSLRCRDARCVPEPRALGAPCDAPSTCKSGLCGEGICVASPDGAACSEDGDCSSALCAAACSDCDTTCLPVGFAFGMPCVHDGQCAPSAGRRVACYFDKCDFPKALGDWCEDPADCESNVCRGGAFVCVPAA